MCCMASSCGFRYVDEGDGGVNDARWCQSAPVLVTASGNGRYVKFQAITMTWHGFQFCNNDNVTFFARVGRVCDTCDIYI